MKTFYLLFLFTVLLPFPFCLLRRKQYAISMRKMLIIYLVFSFVGALGAVVGSINSNGIISGIRLYGLIFFDTLILFPTSHLLKIKVQDLGDYISVPIMAVCSFSKVVCAINGCCKGFDILKKNGEKLYNFPSQWLEMVIWAFIVIVFLFMEKNKKAMGIKWPLTVIWFGIFRFSVDYLRTPSLINYNNVIIFGLNIAKLYCLFLVALGVIVLYFTVRNKLGRNPKTFEFIKLVFGIES